MEVTTDGQIVIGSHDCTEVSTSSETRGCLSFFNPSTSKVSIALFNGNVTGLAPIPGRNVLYAIQGGSFVVYDTTTDKFMPEDHQTRIVGESVDVKVIDNAP
jgi:protein associated with RNAse G/E